MALNDLMLLTAATHSCGFSMTMSDKEIEMQMMVLNFEESTLDIRREKEKCK